MLFFMTDSALVEAAVAAALSQNWQEAIAVNKQILRQSPKNIGALNRLGFAYLKTGKILQGKQLFEKVLKLDTYNRIAGNNIKKINTMKKSCTDVIRDCPVSPLLFLEEPGKTKIVECVNIASTQILSTLSCGQEVFFKLKKYSIDIRDTKGTYIGALPDDLSFKLLKFMKGGNRYSANIKRIAKSCMSVFIRETRRGKKFQNQSSFSGTTSYIPYSHDHDPPESKPKDEAEKPDDGEGQ
jgi:tetratricopeptide (TPR) repeat protein